MRARPICRRVPGVEGLARPNAAKGHGVSSSEMCACGMTARYGQLLLVILPSVAPSSLGP